MAHQSIARKRLYRNSFKSKPIRWMGRQQFVRNVADELKSCWSGICIRHLKTDPRVRFIVGATIFWPLKVPAFQFRVSLLKELWKLRVEGLSTCRCLSKRQPTESRDFWFFFFRTLSLIQWPIRQNSKSSMLTRVPHAPVAIWRHHTLDRLGDIEFNFNFNWILTL